MFTCRVFKENGVEKRRGKDAKMKASLSWMVQAEEETWKREASDTGGKQKRPILEAEDEINSLMEELVHLLNTEQKIQKEVKV